SLNEKSFGVRDRQVPRRVVHHVNLSTKKQRNDRPDSPDHRKTCFAFLKPASNFRLLFLRFTEVIHKYHLSDVVCLVVGCQKETILPWEVFLGVSEPRVNQCFVAPRLFVSPLFNLYQLCNTDEKLFVTKRTVAGTKGTG